MGQTNQSLLQTQKLPANAEVLNARSCIVTPPHTFTVLWLGMGTLFSYLYQAM